MDSGSTPPPTGLATKADPAHDSGATIEAFFAEVKRLRAVAEAAGEYIRVMKLSQGKTSLQLIECLGALAQAVDRWQKGGEGAA